MAIVGFNFTKINGEKSGNVTGKININNNVIITDVKGIDVNLGAKENKGLLVKFKYVCEYTPNVGKIILEGEIITLETVDTVKKCIASWEKDKKIDPEITRMVLSNVLNKSTVQAVIVSKDLSLPAPIPLPKIDAKPESKPASKSAVKKK